jgi:hypothetical protein
MEAATSRGGWSPLSHWRSYSSANLGHAPPLAAKICRQLEADQLADYLFSTIYDRSGTIHLQFLFVGADVL